MLHVEHLRPEKRTGPDLLVKWIKIARIVVWVMLGILILFTDSAKPQEATFFDNFFEVTVRNFWDQNLLFISFIVASLLFIFSFTSILINTMRLKRENDRISISLIITLIISSVGILFYLTMAIN
ncbi:MAG: hypothetical protein CVV02_04105 [Firmicutes bacterium HGW-Firmicutes-7]|nr:MAG: hypothetical protein CVV02_04105 [Firmicutes bacterium HGW-Firmicutes-7]